MNVTVNPGYRLDFPKKSYYPGEVVELDDKEARRLIEAGIVKEGGDATSGSSSPSGQQLNVAKTAELVMAAASKADLDQFRADTRKGVLDAIAKRETELDLEITLGMIGNVHNPADLDEYIKDEKRPAVLEAIEKRRAELAQA